MQSPDNKNKRIVETLVSYGLGYLVSLPFNKPEFLTMRLSVYLASLAFYHWAEYWYVCLFHYEKLHFDSKCPFFVNYQCLGFLINQSLVYMVTMAISLLEGYFTQIAYPTWDPFNYI